jgi:hypothetical protein
MTREGQMTKMMGVVSSESLTVIIERNGFDVAQFPKNHWTAADLW